MATLAFSLAGAAIGSAFGYTSIGWTIGGMLGNALMGGPDDVTLPAQFGPRLSDLKVQTSTYGNVIPRGYGTVRIAGNIIWAAPLTEHATTVTVSSGGGGKGGGGGGGATQSQTTYSYTADCAIAICDTLHLPDGEIIGIRKVWANGHLIYDVGDDSNLFSVIASTSAMTIYTGSSTQTADPTIAAAVGAANTPAYRRTAYVVFNDFAVEAYGNRIPNFEFEVVCSGSIEQLVPYPVYDIESDEDLRGDQLAIDNLVQLGSGGVYLWTVHKIASSPSEVSDPFKRIALYNQYSGDKVLEVDDIDCTELQLIGIGADDRVWFEHRPNGFGYITTSGDVVEFDQFITADALRIIQLYEPASMLVEETVFLSFSSPTPFVQQIYKIIMDETPFEGEDTSQLISVAGERSILHFIQRANRVAGRMYFGAYRLDNAVLAWVGTGRLDSTVATVIRTYNTSNNLYAWIGGTNNQYIYARSLNTGAGNVIEKLSIDGSLVDSCTLPGIDSSDFGGETRFASDEVEFLYVQVEDKIFRIRFATMEVDANATFANEDERILPGDAFESVAITCVRATGIPNQTVRMIAQDRVLSDPPTLAEVVTAECELEGLDATDLDVSDLTSQTVTGYVISRRESARSSIEPLMMAYFFDAVESDDDIKFVSRGGAQAIVIPEDDLAAHVGFSAETPDQLEIIRKQEMELPVAVHIKAFNKSFDYQVTQQSSRRLITQAKQTITVDLALVLTDDEQKQIADITMFALWANRQLHSFQTSREYFKYEPTDLVGVTKNGVVHNLRLTDKAEGADGIIQWKGVVEEVSVYTQTSAGASNSNSPAETPLIGPTNAVFMDIPLLREEDDDAGFYYGGYANASGWRGVKLFQSRDDGDNYSEMTNGTLLVESTVGRAITVLSGEDTTTPQELLDITNTVDVVMAQGTLSTITYEQLMNYGNPAMLGDELIQFMTATLVAADTYRLSGLLRGRLGTESYMATHAVGDRFVLLNENIRSINTPISQVNTESLYKPASIGRTLQQTPVVAFTNTARKKKPLRVARLHAYQEADGDWVITWTRRTRYPAAWADGVDAPLGESQELYEIDILNAAGTTVLRTLQVTAETATYTSAQQTTDFGSAVTNLICDVYQVSPEYGRGDAARFGVEGLHQYWRFRNVNNGQAYLELAEIRLFENGVDVTDDATFSSNPAAPSFGTLSQLKDNDLMTRIQYSTGQSPSFWDSSWYLQFYFPNGAALNGFKQGLYDDPTLLLENVTIEYSDNGTDWFEQAVLTALAEPPADFTLSELYEF